MTDPTRGLVQLVDVALSDLDGIRGTIDAARVALAAAAETVEASRLGLVALREQLTPAVPR